MLSSKHWEESGIISEKHCPLSASCCPNRASPLWLLFSCTVGGTTQPVHLCPKDSGPPCLPLPVCRTLMREWGGNGVGVQSEPSAGNTSTIFRMDAHHVHWEDCMAEPRSPAAAALWVNTGRQHAACSGSHTSTCRWFHFTHSCSSDSFFF